jgi:uncharacterized cofD-like protein
MKKKEKIKIVTIGGGTGSFAILSELRRLKEEGMELEISAVVSMSDSGGSTGILMDNYGVLPPGDVRQCLVALSPQSEFLRKLFTYRFSDGFLENHSFGNIFLSTVEKVTDSFELAVKEAERVLGVLGKIYPVTTKKHQLVVELKSQKIIGEKIISQAEINKANLNNLKKIYLDQECSVNQRLERVFKEADLILVNPGSFYTSIMPNFLVSGFSQLLKESRAKKIFVTNMVTEKGQTDNFTVIDFLDQMKKFAGFSDFDYVFYNNNYKLDNKILERYKEEGKFFVKYRANDRYKKVKFIGGDFLLKPKIDCQNKNFIRYDAKKLLKKVFEVLKYEK